MQAVTRKTLQSVLQVSTRHATRKASRATVAPYVCIRCFHLGHVPRNVQVDPGPEPGETPLQKTGSPEDPPDDSNTASSPSPVDAVTTTAVTTSGGDPNGSQPVPRRPGRPTGARTLRARLSPAKDKELTSPKVALPDWFYEQSVFLPQDLLEARSNIELVGNSELVETPVELGHALSRMDQATLIKTMEEAHHEHTKNGSKSSSVTLERPTDGPSDAVLESSDTVTKDDKPVAEDLPSTAEAINSLPDNATEGLVEDNAGPVQDTVVARYPLKQAVFNEILASVRGGLSLPKSTSNDSFAALKSHCVLLFPQEEGAGGTYFLDEVVQRVAKEVGATLVRVDAQDLEEIAGDHLGDSKQARSNSGISPFGIRSLGYDAQLQHPSNKDPDELLSGREEAEAAEEEEDVGEEEEDDEDDGGGMLSNQSSNSSSRSFPNLQSLLSSGKLLGAAVIRDGVLTPINPFGPNSPLGASAQSGGMGGLFSSDRSGKLASTIERLNEVKITSVLSALISAGDQKLKRVQEPAASSSTEGSISNEVAIIESQAKPKLRARTIVHVRDYRELDGTTSGSALLNLMHSIVAGRRKDGQEIIIMGSSSLRQSARGLNKSWLRHLQTSPEDGMERTIVVPPEVSDASRQTLRLDRYARLREVNMRHLRDVIRRRSGDKDRAITLAVPKDFHRDLDKCLRDKINHIDEWVWNFDRVHRVALLALGTAPNSDKPGPRVITTSDIANVVEMMDQSDAEKLGWSKEVTRQAEEAATIADSDKPAVEDRAAARIAKLTKGCTTHEKKLLGGVVNPENITVGFSNVIQPAETVVDPLRILTSLSLIRPEAFSYGVLASDRIPGVLLYGPPGTGKTMLAKAVAKESGATVLEVSGSEVFDMYVGEGEKNVKAIFSLAKKLSPCVVFIDEADAIFGSRHSHSTRTTHRELINQFLKEWDGMSQTSAFIMVATNRPFDLDDAVLRRLPRRILVDLPTQEERLEILKMHLSGEHLGEDVNLADIATNAKTNLYSGSDLKNLAVAAALSCVKEENENFKETGMYPDKRTLDQRHFDKALSEISASISEDMGTLGQIRKFDEKYGEKSGRKKKTQRWGFGGITQIDDPKEKGTGRVRT